MGSEQKSFLVDFRSKMVDAENVNCDSEAKTGTIRKITQHQSKADAPYKNRESLRMRKSTAMLGSPGKNNTF